MRLYFLLFALLPVILFSKETLTVAIDPEYSPVTYKSFEGKPEGLFVEFWKLWGKKSGYNIKFKFYHWDDTLKAVKDGKVIFQSGLTPDQSWMVSSDKVYEIKTSFYKLQNKKLPKNLKIGSIDTYYASLAKKLYKNAKIIMYKDYLPMIKGALNGDIDLFIDDELAINFFLLQKSVKTRFTTLPNSFHSDISVVTNKKNKKYIKIFNKYFKQISINELANIEDKVLGKGNGFYNQKIKHLYKQYSSETNKIPLNKKEIFLAGFLLFFLIFITIVQYKKSRLLDINLKKFTLAIVLFELSVILFIIYELLLFNNTESKLATVHKNKLKMTQLIYKLKQSSDDLTNFARAYAVTGKKEYLNNYFNILDIRNGIKARPKNSFTIYWELTKDLREKLHPKGKIESFDNILQRLPFTQEEKKKLQTSKRNSDTLVFLEKEAFKDVKEKKLSKAVKILYSKEYFNAKNIIMLPIDDMVNLINNRTNYKIKLLKEKIKEQFRYILFISLLFIFGNILIYLLLTSKINKPIEYLTIAMRDYKNKQNNNLKIFYNDEIGLMYKEFSLMKNIIDKQAIELSKEKQKIEDIHKHTRESIEYASLIQSALIPDNNVFRNYFNDYFVIWHPKDTVGGDIYLFEELRHKDECLIMAIDCTGHGVPGAFVTMIVKAIERQIITNIKNSDDDVSPANILKEFNCDMKSLLKQENDKSISNVGFDGGIIYYNKKDKIIKFAGAQTPLFYIEDEELKVIKGNRHSVGYKKSSNDYEFKEHIIKVKKGMKFYITTDGYLDQNGGTKGFPFGKKQFQNIIKKFHSETLADQQEIFLYELDDYKAKEETNDDVTVISFEI